MELPKILGFIGIGLVGLTTLSAVLAIALPSWKTTEFVQRGIWEFCRKSGNGECDYIDFNEEDATTIRNTMVVRAVCVLGLLCILGTLVAAILKLFVLKSNKVVGSVAGGVAIVAGTLFMVGFAVYADKLMQADVVGTEYLYGAAFGLDVVAWLLAWVAGGLLLAETWMGGEEA